MEGILLGGIYIRIHVNMFVYIWRDKGLHGGITWRDSIVNI